MELLPKIIQIAIVLVEFIHVGFAIGEICFGSWLLEKRLISLKI